MAVRIKLPRKTPNVSRRDLLLGACCVLVVGLLLGGLTLTFYWNKYGRIVSDRLKHPLFEETAKIYAAPAEVRPGQKLTPTDVEQQLQEAGYSVVGQGPASPMGTYADTADSVTVHPGPQSYHAPDGATIDFTAGVVSQITGDQGQQLAAYELEPLLITGLSDQNRTKRRLVTYDELPHYLVPAVTAIEDRRFFEHDGVDYERLLGAALDDLRNRHYSQGGSTLTMQLARGFFLSPEKRIKRKIIEIIITFQLEHRFNKQQIFQMYANEVPLGQICPNARC